jgi:hypothetical protein
MGMPDDPPPPSTPHEADGDSLRSFARRRLVSTQLYGATPDGYLVGASAFIKESGMYTIRSM